MEQIQNYQALIGLPIMIVIQFGLIIVKILVLMQLSEQKTIIIRV